MRGSAWEPQFIVVGAGSAGCVLAKRLSEAGREVLLLEAGGSDSSLSLRIPGGYYRTLREPAYQWGFSTAQEPGLNGRTIAYPVGRVLGGSSSINGLVYIRGHRADYDNWSSLGAGDAWCYTRVLEKFRRSERNQDIDDRFHGTRGELGVAFPRYRTEVTEAFMEAAVGAGHPLNQDFNGVELSGVGRYQLTINNGMRSSASSAFLGNSARTLRIMKNAVVSRLLFRGDEAVGVEVATAAGPLRLSCSEGIVLSAGTINTPKILQLSGVGPSAVLTRHGIPTLYANDQVGANLQDHYQSRLMFATAERFSLNGLSRNWVRSIAAASRFLLDRGGDFSVGAGVVGLFASSCASGAVPDIQFHIIPFSAELPGRLHQVGGITCSVCHLRPKSRGTVQLRSANPADAPVIQFNYLSEQEDVEVIGAGFDYAREIFDRPELSRLVTGRIDASAVDLKDQASVYGYIRGTGTTIFHPVGTCRIGSVESGVVDDRLRVHGLRRLHIADASVMPAIVSGNTNAAAIMIGEMAAQFILEAD